MNFFFDFIGFMAIKMTQLNEPIPNMYEFLLCNNCQQEILQKCVKKTPQMQFGVNLTHFPRFSSL